MKNSSYVLVMLVALSVFLAGCSSQDAASTAKNLADSEVNAEQPSSVSDETSEVPDAFAQQESGAPSNAVVSGSSAQLSAWMTTELKNVKNGENFRISEFAGKPVLIESFAVWCPVCLRQQQESKKLEELAGDSVVAVAINTDPNEDEAKVRSHIEKHGFNWKFAVASTEVSNSLIDDFGTSIVSVPLAPMVLVCADQTTHRLRNGVKSAEDLQNLIGSECGAT